jgi:hypothetical protein
MSIDTGWIADLWATDPGLITAVVAGLVVALVVAVAWPLSWMARTGRLNAKLQIGTAIVQAGMTAAVVSGTYEFFHEGFELPWWEAIAFGIFLEAATWVAVGRILEHAREHTGMGYGGVFFWLFSLVGGYLGVIAGDTAGEMIGRAAIMIVGTGLWFLTLLSKTKPGRLARRLLIAVGALHADDVDVPEEHREFQIRRLTRAIRWANSRGPLRWIGRRTLTIRAEQTTEDVIAEARRRYAFAHHLVDGIAPTSEAMRALLDDIRDETTPSRRAQLEQDRAAIAQREQMLLAATAAAIAAVHADRADLETERAELAEQAEMLQKQRHDVETARLQLHTQRRAPIPTPTKDVPPAGQNPESPAGGDVDLVRRVAEWREQARIENAGRPPGGRHGGRPYGQRAVAEAFGVSRARAAELISAADAYLAQARAQQVNGKHYPIPTTGATP